MFSVGDKIIAIEPLPNKDPLGRVYEVFDVHSYQDHCSFCHEDCHHIEIIPYPCPRGESPACWCQRRFILWNQQVTIPGVGSITLQPRKV